MEDKYPYLGIRNINGQDCVVFFASENYGTVVMSEVENNPEYAFGSISDFNEEDFEFLDPEIVVRINN